MCTLLQLDQPTANSPEPDCVELDTMAWCEHQGLGLVVELHIFVTNSGPSAQSLPDVGYCDVMGAVKGFY